MNQKVAVYVLKYLIFKTITIYTYMHMVKQCGLAYEGEKAVVGEFII